MTPQNVQQVLAHLTERIGRVVLGSEWNVRYAFVAFLTRGHLLLEGVPGVGKTLLARSFSRSLGLELGRVQCTPDLMPGDVIGANVFDFRTQSFTLTKGPVFTEFLLVDEINRTPPKTQSALLEAMAEGAVTIAGARHALKPPFVVLATENPIEMEGTYPLPEAQLDRFLFKIFVPSPDEDTLVGILEATTGTAKATVPRVVDGPTILAMRELVREVRVAGALTRYVARFVRASDPSTEAAAPAARELLRYGAGVRGAQAMLLAAKVVALMDGRAHVAFADLRRVALPALRHRLIPNFEAEADGISTDQIVTRLLDEVPEVSDGVATLAS